MIALGISFVVVLAALGVRLVLDVRKDAAAMRQLPPRKPKPPPEG
jgi:hypothetical protein